MDPTELCQHLLKRSDGHAGTALLVACQMLCHRFETGRAPLTAGEQRCFAVFLDHYTKHGYGPTLEAVGVQIGVSLNQVYRYCQGLRDKGYLMQRKPRGKYEPVEATT